VSEVREEIDSFGPYFPLSCTEHREWKLLLSLLRVLVAALPIREWSDRAEGTEHQHQRARREAHAVLLVCTQTNTPDPLSW